MPALATRADADFSTRAPRGRPARRAARPRGWATGGRAIGLLLLHLDGALHAWMQTTALFVDARGDEWLRVALSLEKDGGALLALRDRDLVRRVVAVGPRHVLAGRDRQLARPEGEAGDDVVGARLHRDGPARRPPREPGQRDHEVLLGARLVALEARLVVRLVVELLIRREGRVFPLAVADVVRILRAPARSLLHDGDAHEVALHEPTVGVLDRVAGGVYLRLVLDQGQDRAAGNRLALARRLDGLRGAVQFAILLLVVTVDGRVEHVVLVARRERDLLAAGGAGDDGQGDERRDQGRDD